MSTGFFLLLQLAAGTAAATFFPATRPEFAYSGRTVRDAGGVVFDWAASSVVFAVQGATSCSVHLKSLGTHAKTQDKYDVLVAEGVGDYTWSVSAALLVEPKTAVHPLSPETLDAAQLYSFWLFKSTEPFNNMFGPANFSGVECTGDSVKLMTPKTPWMPARRLQVLGDSITAGYGAQGSGGTGGGPYDCSDGPWVHESALVSWAGTLSRNLSVELHLQAWSAIGLVHNANGNAAQTKYNMSTLWRFTLGSGTDDDDNFWDLKSWTPHAVISNLGTNDLPQKRNISNSTWISAYRSIATEMRIAYGPSVPLILFCSPWAVKGLCEHNRAAEAALTSEGFVVHAVEFDETTSHVPRSRNGCGGHPAWLSHQFMSQFMSGVLKELLGWSTSSDGSFEQLSV